jgi:hypothetical protein
MAAYGGVDGGKEQSVGSFCESPVDVRSPERAGMGCERKEPFEIVISQCESPFSKGIVERKWWKSSVDG